MSRSRDEPRHRIREAAGVLVSVLLVAGLVRLYSNAVERQYPLSEVAPLIVDLNRDPATTLEVLPGVGPVLARRIVAERNRGGAFAGLADMERRVSGVGPKSCERLAGLVRFGVGVKTKESDRDGSESRIVR